MNPVGGMLLRGVILVIGINEKFFSSAQETVWSLRVPA